VKSKAPIDIPAYIPTLSTTAKRVYDFTHSDIIKKLNYDEIISYFGSEVQAVDYYKESLNSGYPRSAAFLMDVILRGSVARDVQKATRIVLEDLSMLTDKEMFTSADTLVSKIKKPSSKKKILFTSGHWLTGGMERVMSTLFKELEYDYEIFLITPFDERKSHIDIPVNVNRITISDDLFVEHFDSLILSYALLLDIDVVIGFINLFEKQLNLYNLCIGTKIKTIASNHEYYFYPYKSPTHYEVVEKRLSAYTKCDALVWPNGFNAALCGMYVGNSYVIGNPNNYEISRITKPNKRNVIICVGRFDDYVKRVDRIMECFSLVLKKVPDAKLVLVGRYDNDTPFKQDERTTVSDLIKSLAIPVESIDFVGEVSNVQDYYKRAKVLMLTSNSEGFGMVINEAACHGVPSVCNYIPGIEDLVVDGENGFITDQDDLVSMADRVCNILSDEELQVRLGKSSIEKAKSYDARHIGDKWRLLIDSLLDVSNKVDLHKMLAKKLGYSLQNQKILAEVLAKELNEIFYMSIKERGQHKIHNKWTLILYKIVNLPKRLKANIEYEGLLKTINKILSRSYRIIRMRLNLDVRS
jgi:glycosyltransferase involved in cell wall biosynthesis